MTDSTPNLEQRRQQCESLVHSQQTVLLATASPQATPLSSYTPFVRDDNGVFYVFISELAEHTRNLLQNPQASVLLTRSEAETKNVFARERVVFACQAECIERDDPRFEQPMHDMARRFGDTVSLLQGLADFHLFALTPFSGTYVVGFGQAFTIDPQSGAFSHVQPTSKG